MGCIIKNRVGSLEKTQLEEIFKEAMFVHLRILSSFFEVIKNKEDQKAIVDFISKILEKITKEKARKPSSEELERISTTIFWNLNFFVVYAFIDKIVHSLGSDKLTEIVKKVCDEMNAPASFIIKHGILMWYNKNLKIDEIVQRIEEKDFSQIAERVVKLMVVNYFSLHLTSYRGRQKIENKLGIPAKKLLIRHYKES
jgi:histidyl-tRNA synthetase